MKTACLAATALAAALATPPAAAAVRRSCGEGLELRASTAEPAQGDVVLVELRSDRPLAAVAARWQDETLRFWHAPDDARRQQTLVGVDLRLAPGSYRLDIDGRTDEGGRVRCSMPFAVRDGGFAVERLTVDRRYVELDAKDLARARRETARLRAIFAARSPRRLWDTAFASPVPGARPSGNFGKRRILNGEPRSPHSGEDFPAPRGTAVLAPERGRVVLADELFFSGKTVVLDHGLGLFTFYGHLDSIAVRPGELVKAGSVLGRVGATGRVTGPHLHWAARLAGARIDPLELLALGE